MMQACWSTSVLRCAMCCSPAEPLGQLAAVPAPRPRDRRDRRDPRLRLAPQAVVTPPPAGRPGHGSGTVLRRQPVRIVDGRFEGGWTGVYEIVCPDCGDHRDLDYSEV
jgi:hypothetical protein